MKQQPSQESQHNPPAVLEVQPQPLAEKPHPESAIEKAAPPLPQKPGESAPTIITPATEIKPHPFAAAFPRYEDEEHKRFVVDIKQNGLLVPILLAPGNLILDGVERYRACIKAGVEPKFEITQEPPNKWLWLIMALNVRRRHLTASQRAAIAAEMVTTSLGDNQHKGGSANLPTLTQAQAADLFDVSERHVRDGVMIKKQKSDLFEEVKAGRLAITVAADSLRQKPEKGGADKKRAKPKPQESGHRAPGGRNPEIPAGTEEYANWLFERADEKEISMLIAWIEAAQPGDVVHVLRDLQEKRAASAQKPTAKQGSGAAAKGKKGVKQPSSEAPKAPPEGEDKAKVAG